MKKINLNRRHYTMASENGVDAEIVMYGDIVESVPADWWTGEEIPGQYIVEGEFLADLDKLAGCRNITIRMNSCGGDAGVSILIHNRLRELARDGKNLTCIVDGVAMSGGSLIMCACDTVRVNPSSLIMIHKCIALLFGYYNANELNQAAESNTAHDKAQVAIYARKTGLSDTVLMHMMADTTYMTGREAVEKGFADELTEDEKTPIAASADGRKLYVGRRAYSLMPGVFAPDNIPTVSASEPSADEGEDDETHTNEPEDNGEITEGGENDMTLEELRAQYPDLIEEAERSAREAAAAEAVAGERRRMQEIDEVAALFDEDLVREARYGNTACSVQELTYRAAKKNAAAGGSFLAAMKADAGASGAQGVPAAPAAPAASPKNDAEKRADAKATVGNLLGKTKKEG